MRPGQYENIRILKSPPKKSRGAGYLCAAKDHFYYYIPVRKDGKGESAWLSAGGDRETFKKEMPMMAEFRGENSFFALTYCSEIAVCLILLFLACSSAASGGGV